MKWLSYVTPQTVLRSSSQYNRDIRINLESGRYKLLVNGARESGKYIEDLWKFAFSKCILPEHVCNILLFGIAGGTVIHVLFRKYPSAKILGVEIDPKMIEIGRKYFGLKELQTLRMVRNDAKTFHTRKKFDMIVVDLFIGPHVPDFVQGERFQRKINRMLTKNGVVIINYLRQTGYEKKADILEKVMQTLYSSVMSVDRYNNRFFYGKIS